MTQKHWDSLSSSVFIQSEHWRFNVNNIKISLGNVVILKLFSRLFLHSNVTTKVYKVPATIAFSYYELSRIKYSRPTLEL